MELSVREAAALLDCSPRTLRSQLQRGEIKGVKRNGRWRVDRRSLRLNDDQRRRLQERADSVRQAVEDVLPSRLASSAGQKSRSVVDLDAFRRGAEVLREVRGAGGDVLPEASRERAAAQLEEALLALAEAAQQFDRGTKLEAIGRCRAGIARAAAVLLIEAGVPAADPVHGWAQALEGEVLPVVAGFARWAEGLKEPKR